MNFPVKRDVESIQGTRAVQHCNIGTDGRAYERMRNVTEPRWSGRRDALEAGILVAWPAAFMIMMLRAPTV
jgi:hypothetical protein